MGCFGFGEPGPKASLCVSLQWRLFPLHFQFTQTLYCFGGEGYISIKKPKLTGVWIKACYSYFGFSFSMKRPFLTSTKETWGGQEAVNRIWQNAEPVLQLS